MFLKLNKLTFLLGSLFKIDMATSGWFYSTVVPAITCDLNFNSNS